jgi:hypothetical protein
VLLLLLRVPWRSSRVDLLHADLIVTTAAAGVLYVLLWQRLSSCGLHLRLGPQQRFTAFALCGYLLQQTTGG